MRLGEAGAWGQDGRGGAATENNVLFQTVDNAADYGNPPVALGMRPGQIFLHSDWILHGSEPNRSNRRRCGLAMRYLSADVRAYDGWNANSIWCRGTDAGGHWANHPHSDGEVIPTPESASSADPSETHPSAANAGGWATGHHGARPAASRRREPPHHDRVPVTPLPYRAEHRRAVRPSKHRSYCCRRSPGDGGNVKSGLTLRARRRSGGAGVHRDRRPTRTGALHTLGPLPCS